MLDYHATCCNLLLCAPKGSKLPTKIRFAYILVVEKLGAGAGLDDVAYLENVGSRGNGERLLGVLLNEEDGRAKGVYLLYHIKDGVYVQRREAHAGLVEEQEPR